jgi:hypothetical protein
VGKPDGKRPLGKSTRSSEDNIKMGLREIGWGYMNWIHLPQDRDQWKDLVNTVSIRCWESLKYNRKYGHTIHSSFLTTCLGSLSNHQVFETTTTYKAHKYSEHKQGGNASTHLQANKTQTASIQDQEEPQRNTSLEETRLHTTSTSRQT